MENSKPNRRQAINAFRYFLENDLHFGGCEANGRELEIICT
jgi:hypothetical protein